LIDAKIKLFYSLLKNRLVKNSFYTGFALTFIGLVPFTFNFLVARTFGKETLGSINIALSFCLIITIFITNFFGSSANKFLAEYRGRLSLKHFLFVFKIMVYGSIFILSFISLILIWKWSFISKNFSLPYNLIYPIIAYIFLRSFYILFRRALYGMDLVQSYALNEIISDILMLISISYICHSKQEEFLIHSYLISYIIFIIISIRIFFMSFKTLSSKLINEIHFSKKDTIIKFSKYGAVSMIGTAASTGTGYLSIIITGIYLDNADAGLYSAVLTIISILMFIPKLFTQVFLPEFSKLFGENNKEKIIFIIKQSTWLMVGISGFICIPLFLFSVNILSIFGEEFEKANIILRIILPSIFIRMISIPFVSFLSGTKYIIYPNIGGVLIFFVSIFFWLTLVPQFQLKGIAIGYTAGIFIGIGYQIIMAILKIKTFNIKN